MPLLLQISYPHLFLFFFKLSIANLQSKPAAGRGRDGGPPSPQEGVPHCGSVPHLPDNSGRPQQGAPQEEQRHHVERGGSDDLLTSVLRQGLRHP